MYQIFYFTFCRFLIIIHNVVTDVFMFPTSVDVINYTHHCVFCT